MHGRLMTIGNALAALLPVMAIAPLAADARVRSPTIVPDGQRFACTPTAVWDGDGPIWCAEGPHIRLQGIAAREIGDHCRNGQPCPSASAITARDALVTLLGGARGTLATSHVRVAGPRLNCRSSGAARGDRTGALCALPDGRDLSCAMVRSGTVLRWARYGGGRLCR